MSDTKKTALPTWKETFKLNARGFSVLFSRFPSAMSSKLIHRAWNSLSPYVTVWLSARLIDEIASSRDPKRLVLLAALTVASALATGLVSALIGKWKNIANAEFWERFKIIFYDKFGEMDFSDADSPAVREKYTTVESYLWGGNWGLWRLINNAETAVWALCSLFGGVALSVTLFIRAVPGDAGGLTVLNNPLVVLTVILAMAGVTYVSPLIENYGQSFWAKLSGDHLAGNRLFTFFLWTIGREDRAMEMRVFSQQKFLERYNHNIKDGTFSSNGPFSHLARTKMGPCSAASAALSVVFTGIVYAFVCLKALAGAFGVGMVTQYVGAVSRLSGSISDLIFCLGDMRNNAPFIRDSLEILDIPNKMYRGTLTVEKRRDRNYEIEFRNVSFKYPGSDAYALKNVNMKFRVGSRLAIVGQNGSGKSTFIKLLCRLYDPTEGEILLNGIDIRKYDYANYMSVFSVVFQDFRLLAFKLGENVGGCRDYDREKVLDSLEKAGFSERLATLPDGLDTWLYKNFEDGVNLSGGEAQKLAIARALYKNAPFIILDEPTAALDPMAEAEIYSRFNDISGDRTAIYISHRLSSTRFCDEIAVFHAGEIVQQGTHAGLLADEAGQYARLWNSQAQYYTES